jgi:hypothetical protein
METETAVSTLRASGGMSGVSTAIRSDFATAKASRYRRLRE